MWRLWRQRLLLYYYFVVVVVVVVVVLSAVFYSMLSDSVIIGNPLHSALQGRQRLSPWFLP